MTDVFFVVLIQNQFKAALGIGISLFSYFSNYLFFLCILQEKDTIWLEH